MKKIIAMLMSFSLILSVITVSAIEYPQKFYDVAKDHWAFEQIAELTNRGVINGYTDGSFKPNNTVTRAEWAKIMVGTAGIPVTDTTPYFSDTQNHWALSYINAAKPYLTAYADGTYRPDQAIVREDVTMAMVRLKGYDLSAVDFSVLSKFTDMDSVSNNIKTYVAIAVEKGLISGYEDNTFRGQATLTRAEAATLLWRAFQLGNNDKVTDVIADNSQQTTSPSHTVTPTPDTKPSTPPAQKPKETQNQTPDAKTENKPENREPIEEQPPEEPPAPKKYSVETIAKPSAVRSMVIDASGDIYYLSKNQIKKIENGKETTLALDLSTEIVESEAAQLSGIQPDSFYGATITALESDRPIRFQDPELQFLSYDAANDTIYVTAYCKTNSKTSYKTYTLIGVWNIAEPSEPVATQYFNHDAYASPVERYTPQHNFHSVVNRSNIIFYGYSYGGNPPFCSINLTTGIANEYSEGVSTHDCDTFGILNGNLCVLNGSDDTIMQYQVGQKEFKNIYLDGSVSLRNMQSAVAHDNAFYCIKDSNVYQINAQGTIQLFVDSAEVDFLDGLPIESVGEMAFDPDGNLVFHDTKNGVIRRINI